MLVVHNRVSRIVLVSILVYVYIFMSQVGEQTGDVTMSEIYFNEKKKEQYSMCHNPVL